MNNYLSAKGANQLAIALAAIALALAVATGWFAYDTTSRGGYVLAAILVIIAILIPQAIKVPISGSARLFSGWANCSPFADPACS
jgi:hypothetical protein